MGVPFGPNLNFGLFVCLCVCWVLVLVLVLCLALLGARSADLESLFADLGSLLGVSFGS